MVKRILRSHAIHIPKTSHSFLLVKSDAVTNGPGHPETGSKRKVFRPRVLFHIFNKLIMQYILFFPSLKMKKTNYSIYRFDLEKKKIYNEFLLLHLLSTYIAKNQRSHS